MANGIELLNVIDLTKKFKVTKETIYKRIKDGEIKAIKIGGQWYLRATDLERMFEPRDEETNN